MLENNSLNLSTSLVRIVTNHTRIKEGFSLEFELFYAVWVISNINDMMKHTIETKQNRFRLIVVIEIFNL